MARRKGDDISGWVVLDKPLGMTSTQAVSVVKRLFNARKVGHSGTLDPLATGVLPLALGEATKTVPFVFDGRKTYRFTVSWGVQTNTDDQEGHAVEQSDLRPVRRDIERILSDYIGEIEQTPPQFSALRVNGARAYDLARAGEVVEIKPRIVQIHDLKLIETGTYGAQENTAPLQGDKAQDDSALNDNELSRSRTLIPHMNQDLADQEPADQELADQKLDTPADYAIFDVECGKGTYIRSLARDFGRQLGCFGHVEALQRTKTGPFLLQSTISLDNLKQLGHSAAGREALYEQLKPVETALDDIPALAVSGSDAVRLKRGQAVLLRGRDAPITKGAAYAISKGVLVAIGEVSKGSLRPVRVFNLPA